MLFSVWVMSHCVYDVSAANILALCAMPSPSHSLWCYHYLSALSARGHQVLYNNLLRLDYLGVKLKGSMQVNQTTFIDLMRTSRLSSGSSTLGQHLFLLLVA